MSNLIASAPAAKSYLVDEKQITYVLKSRNSGSISAVISWGHLFNNDEIRNLAVGDVVENDRHQRFTVLEIVEGLAPFATKGIKAWKVAK